LRNIVITACTALAAATIGLSAPAAQATVTGTPEAAGNPTQPGWASERPDRCDHALYRRFHRKQCEHPTGPADHKGPDDKGGTDKGGTDKGGTDKGGTDKGSGDKMGGDDHKGGDKP
jgi:hypothetical protein